MEQPNKFTGSPELKRADMPAASIADSFPERYRKRDGTVIHLVVTLIEPTLAETNLECPNDTEERICLPTNSWEE
jgi:hypothetical protein